MHSNNSLDFGIHALNINISIDNDTFAENNSASVNFTVNNSSTGQYVNTFGDVNEDEWLIQTIGKDIDLWQKGKPTTTKFNSIIESGYVTNLTENYTDETVSYLISPCYNLTQLENPVLKFDMVFDIEKDWDVLYMEYTVDNGKTWEILGTASDPNWYNSSFIDPQRPITVGKQWTGTDTALKEYSYDLAAHQNESNIIFRFVFATDQAANEEGAVIDNFTIDATAILAVNDFENTAFNVYPNPSNGNFKVEFTSVDLSDTEIQLFDLLGRKVFKKIFKNNQVSFDESLSLKHISSGFYILQVKRGKSFSSKKIRIDIK